MSPSSAPAPSKKGSSSTNVEVVLISASGLKNPNMFGGKFSPCAVITVPGTSIRHICRASVHGATSPVWNETVRFEIDDAVLMQDHPEIVVEIFSSTALDTSLGAGRLSLHGPLYDFDKLYNFPSVPVYRLSNKGKEWKPHGSLSASLKVAQASFVLERKAPPQPFQTAAPNGKLTTSSNSTPSSFSNGKSASPLPAGYPGNVPAGPPPGYSSSATASSSHSHGPPPPATSAGSTAPGHMPYPAPPPVAPGPYPYPYPPQAPYGVAPGYYPPQGYYPPPPGYYPGGSTVIVTDGYGGGYRRGGYGGGMGGGGGMALGAGAGLLGGLMLGSALDGGFGF